MTTIPQHELDEAVAESPDSCKGGANCTCCRPGCTCGCRAACPVFRRRVRSTLLLVKALEKRMEADS
jgi:hypothetical protein